MSSKVEQLLKRWEQERTVLKIELASRYIVVFGKAVISAFQPHQLLLDGDSCEYKISLSEATVELRADDSRFQPTRLSQKEVVIKQLQISLPENHRVLLGEMTYLE